MIRNKKGFTLVELCIVLALISIVVTMATTFIATYRHQVIRVTGDRDTINDLSQIQRITREWIAYYDDYNSDIDAIDSEGGFSKLKTSGGAQLYYDPAAKKLIWADDSNSINNTYSFSELEGLHFSSVKNSGSSEDGSDARTKLIICDADIGDSSQKLLFTVFTGIQRFRYLNPERTK